MVRISLVVRMPNTTNQGFDVELRGMGDKGVLRILDGLDRQVRKKIMGKAAFAAMVPVLKSAKARVLRNSDRTGMLALTLKRKKKDYGDGAITWVGIGPEMGVSIDHPEFGPVTPSNYAHLVEFGFVNRGGGITKPKPFLRPALDANFHMIQRIIAEKTRSGIARYLKKTVKKL